MIRPRGPAWRVGPGAAAWALASALALAGCQGGGGGEAVAPTTAAPAADVGDKVAYCALAKDLAARRDAAAAAAKATDDAEAQELFRQFARDHLDEARRLEGLAPGEIRKDVATVVEGLERVADGETTAFAQRRFLVADGRVNRYDATACASP